jgi:hypothetical protein
MALRILISLLMAFAAIKGVLAAEPKGNRILAMAINEGPGANFDSSFEAARAAGLQAVALNLDWDEVEKEPGVYRPEPNWLEIANKFYPPYRIKVELAINPIDTTADRRPQWLKEKSWDDPAVIEAYVRVINWALANTQALDRVSLSLGNEVDVLLGESVADWTSYSIFAAETAKAIKASHPELRIGIKTTFASFKGPVSKSVSALHAKMDIALLTYYPLNDDFTVKPPGSVADDMAFALDVLQGREVHFAEVGYPTSAACGSSPERQVEFVRQVFAAWDKHADQIRLINFVWVNDIGKDVRDDYVEFYGVNAPCFAEYLATLGLRSGGVDKPAFKVLAEEAKKRGW